MNSSSFALIRIAEKPTIHNKKILNHKYVRKDLKELAAIAAVSPPMLCSTKKVLVRYSVIVIISKATAIPMVMTPIVNNSFDRSSSSHKIIIKMLVIRINPALIKLILFFKNQKTFSAFFKEWLSFS